MKFTEAQFQMSQLRAQRYLALISSGEYKNCPLFQGSASEGVPFSEEEKLTEAFGILDNHINNVQKCLDFWEDE